MVLDGGLTFAVASILLAGLPLVTAGILTVLFKGELSSAIQLFYGLHWTESGIAKLTHVGRSPQYGGYYVGIWAATFLFCYLACYIDIPTTAAMCTLLSLWPCLAAAWYVSPHRCCIHLTVHVMLTYL